MAKVLHLDFETRSDINLKTAGLHNYAKGRHTDIIMACYAFDDGPVQLWVRPNDCPEDVYHHIESGGEVHAHNAAFEKEMCNNVGTRLYGWPHLYDSQLVCTLAMSYAMGLPGHLGAAAAALGISQQKDNIGYRLMLQYCQPRAVDSFGKIQWWEEPSGLKRLAEYCAQDVVVEREIGKRMLKLSHYERSIWQLDQKINGRGIKIDLPAVKAALSIVEAEKQKLIKEIQDVSDNTISTPSSIAQIKNFLALFGLDDVESIAKVEAAELLDRDDLPTPCRKVLEIRAEAGKTSTAKLDSMLCGAQASDGRFRGAFQYSGANTRRWAGRRVQLQNLPRTKISPALVNDILCEMPKLNGDKMRLYYGPPLDVISNCLRGFLVAEEGKEFLCCDFSSIEARVIAWLAGQENVLEIFRTHGKVYEHAASSIFGKPMADISPDERQIGKVAILALGYQGGVGALQKMAKAYGVRLEPAYQSLWSRATSGQKEFVEKRYDQTKADYPGISREEFIASDLTKVFWRMANPKIVEYWHSLESCAIMATKLAGQNGLSTTISTPIKFKVAGSFLWARLPSDGTLCYPYPQVAHKETKWGTSKETLSYMSEDINHKWTRFNTYGGSIAENVTQSFARDILADAMLRLESHGYSIVAHVHDEIICEETAGAKSVQDMANIMSEIPTWAGGLPIAANGWAGKRYRKS